MYPVYVIENLTKGQLDCHQNGLFIFCYAHIKRGKKYYIEGNLRNGFRYYYIASASSRDRDEKDLIGYIPESKFTEFEDVCRSIHVPGPQWSQSPLDGILERDQARCCRRWTVEVIQTSIQRDLLAHVNEDGLARLKKRDEEAVNARTPSVFGDPEKPEEAGQLDGTIDTGDAAGDQVIGYETPLSVKADVTDKPPFNPYQNDTFPVFVIESLGWLRKNHGGLFVVTNTLRVPRIGVKYDLQGEVDTGLKYRREDLHEYRIDERYFIGYIKKVDWKKFEHTLMSIPIPGPRKELQNSPGTLEREEAKFCQDWTCQAVESLMKERILVVDRHGFVKFQKSNAEHKKAYERASWEKPWKSLRG